MNCSRTTTGSPDHAAMRDFNGGLGLPSRDRLLSPLWKRASISIGNLTKEELRGLIQIPPG